MLHQQLLKYFAASRDAAAPIGAHVVDEATNKSRGRGDGIKPESAARRRRRQSALNLSTTRHRRLVGGRSPPPGNTMRTPPPPPAPQ